MARISPSGLDLSSWQISLNPGLYKGFEGPNYLGVTVSKIKNQRNKQSKYLFDWFHGPGQIGKMLPLN